MTTLLCDCEADGFLDEATRLWILQIGTPDGPEVDIYADQRGYRPLSEGLERMAAADRLVFHNGLNYDFPLIEKLHPGYLRREQIVDTLVIGRLLFPEIRAQSLDDWGKRLGEFKGEFSDFSRFSAEMVEYGIQDIRVMRKLWAHLKARMGGWQDALRLEHDVAWVIHLQERNGFTLDVKKATMLEAELRQELYDIETELQEIFPPIWVPSLKAPFVPKKDNRKSGYTAGAPFSKIELQTFNPGSRQQIAERLISRHNWKPRTFTATGIPEINEGVLADLPYPEAPALLRYLRVTKQLGQLADGDNAWLKLVNEKTGRVHGRVNTNGTRTRRMAHFAPNLGQVDKKDPRMREVWTPRAGWMQVGCDAEGAQARGLAHYLARYDGGASIERIVNGSKELKTDTHSANLTALEPLGLVTRDGAKTILYALMFGAGDAKLGKTLQDDRRENGYEPVKMPLAKLGKAVRAAIATSMVGFDRLSNLLKEKSRNPGYIRALDGGRLAISSAHTALSTLLQAFEAVVMKKALVIFHYEYMPAEGFVHGVDFGYLVNVHDEVQMECRPEIADRIGQLFAKAITDAGERLGVRCPMLGAYEIGQNWRETH